jgi:Gpi18-like mannosyltransferase
MMKKILSFLFNYKYWILAYTLALLIRIAISLPLIHDWDGFVFLTSAKNMLHGITPYQTVQSNSPIIYPDSDRPMTEQWYGYPPLPLIMFTIPYALFSFTGVHMTQMMQNFAIKSPFILGDILCAFLMMKFLKKWSQKLANRASLLVLFNPLLIWISSAWGMFDIWSINFLLLFLLALRSKKTIWTGIFFALAIQVKLFSVFYLPAAILFFFQNVKEGKKRVSFLISFVLTTLIIDVPFFLSSPQGFLNQNLIMHLARPPQGIGIPGILDYVGFVYHSNIFPIVIIGSILTVVSVLIFNIFSIGYMKGKEGKFLTVILLIFTSTLLFNKVVNEQYYVVLVGLLILLTHLPKSEENLFSRKLLVFFEEIATFSVLIAGVVLGFHFLTFLPSFLSDGVLKTSTNFLVFYFSSLFPQLPLYTYPNSLWTYYNLPVTVVYILLIPLIIVSVYVVTRGGVEVFRVWKDIKSTIISVNLPKVTFLRSLIGFGIVVLITLFIIPFSHYLKATSALKLVDLVDPHATPTFPAHPKVGTFYDVWWNNASHLPSFPDDAWNKTTLTPQDGYYTSKNSYYVEHIKEMKQAGIDFALIPYHLYDRERYITFGYYAEKLGFYYAPMIELADILGSNSEYQPTSPNGQKMLGASLSEKTRKAFLNVFISSLADNIHSKALLHINGKPVVFVFYGDWFIPSWDAQSKKQLAQKIIDKYSQSSKTPFLAISKAWGINIATIEDVEKRYPASVQGFNQDNVIDRDYHTAFVSCYEDFWHSLQNDLETRMGKITLLSTYPPYDPPSALDSTQQQMFALQFQDFSNIHAFDGEFFYGLSSTWYSWRYYTDQPDLIKKEWETQLQLQAMRDRRKHQPVILTVTSAYNERLVRPFNSFEPIASEINGVNTYDWGWETVLKNNPDFVLITSWNEFFEGTAIEPTKQYGSYYLKATKKWTDKFKKEAIVNEK